MTKHFAHIRAVGGRQVLAVRRIDEPKIEGAFNDCKETSRANLLFNYSSDDAADEDFLKIVNGILDKQLRALIASFDGETGRNREKQ